MTDFLQYVLSEVKHKRLAKAEALDLLRQFHSRESAEIYGESPVPRLHSLLHRNT